MKKVLFCAAAGLSMMMSSCNIVLPVAATSNPIGAKTGTSQATVILSVLYFGDAGIQKAAKAGGITRVSTVDLKMTSILGIYGTYEAIVTGE